MLEILGFLMFLGSRSRRGPEPPRDENFEDSERIFKILEENSSDFMNFLEILKNSEIWGDFQSAGKPGAYGFL